MAFGSTADAVEWCMDVQLALVSADWPKELIDHPGAAEEWDEINERCGPARVTARITTHARA
jgi:hypothetical protein